MTALPFLLLGLVAFLALQGDSGGGGGRSARGGGATRVKGVGKRDGRVLRFAWTSEDVDYLARILMMEAARAVGSAEWAGIAWCAVNRALERHAAGHPLSIRSVVATTAWSGGGDRGRAFVERINSDYPERQRTWADAIAFAEELLQGQIANPIGERTHFVHPTGMPRCVDGECSNAALMCVEGRCLPGWIVARADGGRSEYPPVEVDRAVFAGPPNFAPPEAWPVLFDWVVDACEEESRGCAGPADDWVVDPGPADEWVADAPEAAGCGCGASAGGGVPGDWVVDA